MASLSDRRQHARLSAENATFIVSGQPASLVDWSFGGLGVRFDDPVDFEISREVDIRVHDRKTDSWEVLNGTVRRIEPTGVVGIEFSDEGEATVRVLLRVLGNRLMGAHL